MQDFTGITKNEIENGFTNAELNDYEDLIRSLDENDPEIKRIWAEEGSCLL